MQWSKNYVVYVNDTNFWIRSNMNNYKMFRGQCYTKKELLSEYMVFKHDKVQRCKRNCLSHFTCRYFFNRSVDKFFIT